MMAMRKKNASTYGVSTPMRLVAKIEGSDVRVYKNTDWDEYVVKPSAKAPARQWAHEATKADAMETARFMASMVKRVAGQIDKLRKNTATRPTPFRGHTVRAGTDRYDGVTRYTVYHPDPTIGAVRVEQRKGQAMKAARSLDKATSLADYKARLKKLGMFTLTHDRVAGKRWSTKRQWTPSKKNPPAKFDVLAYSHGDHEWYTARFKVSKAEAARIVRAHHENDDDAKVVPHNAKYYKQAMEWRASHPNALHFPF